MSSNAVVMSDDAVKTRDDAKTDSRLEDEDLKRRFAHEWHKMPDFPYRAISVCFPNSGRDINVICQAVESWRNDPVVLEERERLAGLGAIAELPTKESIALTLWKKAQEDGRTISDQLALIREINNMMGHYAPKNSSLTLNDPNGLVNRVMRVPDQGPEDAWHKRAQEQQAGLIDEARSSVKH